MLTNVIKKAVRYLYPLTTIGLSKGLHITRYYMYNHLSQFSEPRHLDLRVLSISHSQSLARLLGFSDEQITKSLMPLIQILMLLDYHLQIMSLMLSSLTKYLSTLRESRI